MKIGIFIFTRDLRLNDNTGLIELSKIVTKIIPIFVFTQEQIGEKNRYRSIKQISFMRDCLNELNSSLNTHKSKLYTFYGSHDEILEQFFKKINSITHVHINEDYTPYAGIREKKIRDVCNRFNIEFQQFRDHLLLDINEKTALKKDGKHYSKFTPFFNSVRNTYEEPTTNKFTKYIREIPKLKNIISIENALVEFPTETIIKGGRSNALKIINDRKSNYKIYNKSRNELSYLTSGLSPYIKFGCISIREIMKYFRKSLSKNNDLIKQLYWREFYYHIAIHNPHVLNSQNYNKKYDKVKWITSGSSINKWKKGITGIPLVDAAMRELNTDGTMHNRARLVVASFLTKNMFWHWKYGEQYFASKLIDYDPIVNNGNWQWCSGSGVDAQPYFRIFNPFSQSKKYDKNAEYIKKWIPELKYVEINHIHNWDKYYDKYPEIKYPRPFIDVNKSAKSAAKKLKAIFK